MKTMIFLNTKLLGLVILIMVAGTALGQKTYLTIYQSDNMEDQITYPPGTPYELLDEDGKVLVTDKSEAGTYMIEGPSTLVIQPTYKQGEDRFELTEGKLKINLTADFGKGEKSSYRYHSNGVTAEKTLTDSEKYEGLQNVKLELSNGIVFTYIDGTAKATLDGEDLRIDYKYIIYSKLGVAKVSFNPDNGVLYWVFEPQG